MGGKYFIMFLKEKSEGQEENCPGGTFHLIFVAHNGKRFDMTFLMKALRNNVKAKFSGHISILQKSLQLYTATLASNSRRNC